MWPNSRLQEPLGFNFGSFLDTVYLAFGVVTFPGYIIERNFFSSSVESQTLPKLLEDFFKLCQPHLSDSKV